MQMPRKSHITFYSMMQPAEVYAGKITTVSTVMNIPVPVHLIQKQLSLYEWRKQHCSDIISYEWLKLEPFNQTEVTFTLKPMQKLTNLEEIHIIKGNKLIKSISKIFIAFSKIYQKFGPVELLPSMIAFDSFYEPFVWMNSEHIKNGWKRDHISEFEFASNILCILLNNNHKFQNSQFLHYSSQLKGQQLSLKQLSSRFDDFYQRELQSKKHKMMTRQQSILSFRKQSKPKRKTGFQSKNKLNRQQNGEIYHSFLKNGQQSKFNASPKASSLKDLKFERPLSNFQADYIESEIRLNVDQADQMEQEAEVNSEMKQGFFAQQDLQVSFQFGNDESMCIVKEVIELEKLDKLQCFLTMSINNDQRH